MKKTNLAYWVVTGLFAAFMLFSAIPDAMATKDAVDFITALGYPKYFVPFIGIAKILGVIGILVPGYPRVREWAYAGLFFDLIGATYSGIAKGGFEAPILFMILPIGFLFWSYYLGHKKGKVTNAPV